VEEVNRGCRSSFEILMERYQNKIFGMVLHMTDDRELAKDITQEIFLRVYCRLSSYDPKYKFFSWLYRIALNETLNRLASARHHYSLDKVAGIAIQENDREEEQYRSQLLKHAIRSLKKNHRSLILLKYYFGLSCQEIADATGISEQKVRDRLFNARNALRKTLEDKKFFGHVG